MTEILKSFAEHRREAEEREEQRIARAEIASRDRRKAVIEYYAADAFLALRALLDAKDMKDAGDPRYAEEKRMALALARNVLAKLEELESKR